MPYFHLTIKSGRFLGKPHTVPPARHFFCVSEQDAVDVCREFYEPFVMWLHETPDTWILSKLKGKGLVIWFGFWKWDVVKIFPFCK